jgi:hypothetical protein
VWKIVRSIDSFLDTGIFTPIGKYELAEQADIGVLVGFNENGKLIKVEGLADASFIKPVGVVSEGSTITVADKRYLPNGKAYKEIGDFQELYMKFKMLNVEDVWVSGNVGAEVKVWKIEDMGKAVFLTNGKLVADVANVSAGHKFVKVGVLGDPARKEIIVYLLEEVMTKAVARNVKGGK